jgi:uncharacterized lipoprotein YajG
MKRSTLFAAQLIFTCLVCAFMLVPVLLVAACRADPQIISWACPAA